MIYQLLLKNTIQIIYYYYSIYYQYYHNITLLFQQQCNSRIQYFFKFLQNMEQELVEDWMTLADQIETTIIPFGSMIGSEFKLYEVYELYFYALKENIVLMKAQNKNNSNDFDKFLDCLEEYIQNQVFSGKSNYQNYQKCLQQLFQTHKNSKQLFDKFSKIYEQPSLSLYIKPISQPKQVIQKTNLKAENPKIIEIINLQKVIQLNPQYIQLPTLNAVFVGQVDNGKSTLLGRILKQFNYAQSKNDQSISLTSFTDIYESQKEKGKTFQFSKYTIELEKYKLNLFDTPGHKNYSSNMIMALRIADVVILVVSAKKGEFEAGFGGGITKQVLIIGNVFQIKNLIVVITKMSTINWDSKEFIRIKTQLQTYIKGNFCYENIQFIAFDSIDAKNFDKKIFKRTRTLSQCLKTLPLIQRYPKEDLRLPVFDIQQVYGSKQIYGKIQSGFIYQQMPIKIYPQNIETTIVSILKDNKKIPYASSGEFIIFTTKSNEDIKRGDLITFKIEPLLTDQILCTLESLQVLLISGFECIIHLHEITETVEVQILSRKQNNKYLKANFLKKGEVGIVKIKFCNKIGLQKGKLGNFILRNGNSTIGIGKVLKIRKNDDIN